MSWSSSFLSLIDSPAKELAKRLGDTVCTGAPLRIRVDGKDWVVVMPLSEATGLEDSWPEPALEGYTLHTLFLAVSLIAEHHPRGDEIDRDELEWAIWHATTRVSQGDVVVYILNQGYPPYSRSTVLPVSAGVTA